MKTLLLLCVLAVPPGQFDIKLETIYGHNVDGQQWIHIACYGSALGPAIARHEEKGQPIGWRWSLNGQVVKECDEHDVFSDGFEIGTAIWSQTVGGG